MRTRLGISLKGKAYLGLSFVVLSGSLYGAAAHAKHQAAPPIYTTGDGIPDAASVGNIDQAVQQTQHLLTALQAVNYDPTQLPDYSLMTLPDAQYAEDRASEPTDASSYCFPDASVPEQSQIACFTDVDARQNRSYYNGDTSSAAPSGYFLVAWKNGTVQKVPVSDVRRLPTADGSSVDCFPGMTGYDTSLALWRQ